MPARAIDYSNAKTGSLLKKICCSGLNLSPAKSSRSTRISAPARGGGIRGTYQPPDWLAPSRVSYWRCDLVLDSLLSDSGGGILTSGGWYVG